MTQSIRESVHHVSAPENLDASLDEVFTLMLGVACRRGDEPAEVEPETVTAVVGFGGLLSGACVLRCGARPAQRVAGLLAGMELTELDDTVKDAMGEVCNMLAGAWKGWIPELAPIADCRCLL